MEVHNNTVRINKKLDVSLYTKAGENINHLGSKHSRIGSALGAVNKILANSRVVELLMGEVIGISTNDQNWGKEVRNYMHSISVPVPNAGLPLDLSLTFNLDDNLRRKELDTIVKTNPKIKTDEDLMKYILANDKITESEIVKYATPVNIPDYLLYLYCLEYGDVANQLSDLDKSPKIRFFIYREAEEQRKKDELSKVQLNVSKQWSKIAADSDKIREAFYLFNQTDIMSDRFDKSQLHFSNIVRTLTEALSYDPAKLQAVITSRTLSESAEVLKYISHGTSLNVIKNTTTIMDTAGDKIGKNLKEAVAYLFSDEGNIKLKEIRATHESLTKID